MNAKMIAAGIVTIVVVAAIVGVVATNHDKNDDAYNVEGKWSLSYYEWVSLVDDNHIPFTNANDCPMTCGAFEKGDDSPTINIDRMGEYFISLDLLDIGFVGTIDHNAFQFREKVDGTNTHQYIGNGYLKDGYISLSMYQLCLENQNQICCAIYARFIPENSEHAFKDDRIDYANLGMERVDSTSHKITDFTHGTGHGTDLPMANMEYVKSQTMISLFNLTGSRNGIGVQALISHGTSPSGIAIGTVCGNMKFDGGFKYAILGDSLMNNGKLTIRQTLHNGNDMSWVQHEFNVKYTDGRMPTSHFLDQRYEGTVSMHYSNGKNVSGHIVKDFKTQDNAIYAVEDHNGIRYEWFGTILVNKIQIFVTSNDVNGYISGTVNKDGTVTIFGILVDGNNESVAVRYDLRPVSQ